MDKRFKELAWEKIKPRRLELGLSQQHVASLADVTVETISKIENGRQKRVRVARAKKLADALQWQLSDVELGAIDQKIDDITNENNEIESKNSIEIAPEINMGLQLKRHDQDILDVVKAGLLSIVDQVQKKKGIDPDILKPLFEHLNIDNVNIDNISEKAEGAVHSIIDKIEKYSSVSEYVSRQGPLLLPIDELRLVLEDLITKRQFDDAFRLARESVQLSRRYLNDYEAHQYENLAAIIALRTGYHREAREIVHSLLNRLVDIHDAYFKANIYNTAAIVEGGLGDKDLAADMFIRALDSALASRYHPMFNTYIKQLVENFEAVVGRPAPFASLLS
ncbi:helix-turn-helix domain-containing protein [Methylobacterium tarhaniae]|uniref:helix-turn-helix domain-containing protein n=1 Tax=Methylobacterium tarhaniae TaxID=1187852 RepID=UPI003CFBCA3A